MPAPKGHPKYGGRTKGTTNKATQIKRTAEEICSAANYDPIQAMVDLIRDPRTTTDQKITLHKEIVKYVYPQKRAMDITANIDVNFLEAIKQLESLPDEKVIELYKNEYTKLIPQSPVSQDLKDKEDPGSTVP